MAAWCLALRLLWTSQILAPCDGHVISHSRTEEVYHSLSLSLTIVSMFNLKIQSCPTSNSFVCANVHLQPFASRYNSLFPSQQGTTAGRNHPVRNPSHVSPTGVTARVKVSIRSGLSLSFMHVTCTVSSVWGKRRFINSMQTDRSYETVSSLFISRQIVL